MDLPQLGPVAVLLLKSRRVRKPPSVTLCYETLPFVFDFKLERVSGTASSSVVIVVSSLVSLMADQVASLRKRGVKAAILSGHGSVAKELQVMDKELRTRL